jgi:hypothetical protein
MLIKKINNMSDIKSTLGLALEPIETVVVKDMFLSCTSKIKQWIEKAQSYIWRWNKG